MALERVVAGPTVFENGSAGVRPPARGTRRNQDVRASRDLVAGTPGRGNAKSCAMSVLHYAFVTCSSFSNGSHAHARNTVAAIICMNISCLVLEGCTFESLLAYALPPWTRVLVCVYDYGAVPRMTC